MIVRVTARLGKKIGHVPSQVLPLAANPFTDWSANVFFADRTQYIIITNTASLYSAVMYGRGITDNSVFLQRAISTLLDTLRGDGFGFIFERLIAPYTLKVFLSKSLNRTVTGSMNDLVYQAKECLEREDISPFDLSFRLNEAPMSQIGYESPREAFHKLKPASVHPAAPTAGRDGSPPGATRGRPSAVQPEVEIARGYIPGSIGRVAEMNGDYYHRNWGFGLYFEAKVATELSEFLGRYDEGRDGFWTVLADGRIQGSIGIDGIRAEREGAHLRWFIVSDALRGKGAGGLLLSTAVDFCRKRGYGRIYLWTFEGLGAARHLYEKAGFRLVEERRGAMWGVEVNEQLFECAL